MRAASTVIAIGSALALAAPSAHALRFGRISNATQLGQALNFAVVVRLDAGETLARECVSAEVLSGENKLQPGQVRVTLEVGNDPSERSVRITSSTLIDEPLMTVAVTLGCSAKMTRRFTAFIDPPIVHLAQAAPGGAASTLAPQRADSQVAPLLAIVPPGKAVLAPPRPAAPGATRAKARPVGAAQGPARDGARDAARDGAPVAEQAAARQDPVLRGAAARAVVATRLASAGPRLQLEATTPSAGARAAPAGVDAREVALPAPAASVPAPDEQASLLESERQRVVLLEDGLARLRGDSLAAQKTLDGLQTRLKAAEAERYANPLVYALAWPRGCWRSPRRPGGGVDREPATPRSGGPHRTLRPDPPTSVRAAIQPSRSGRRRR